MPKTRFPSILILLITSKKTSYPRQPCIASPIYITGAVILCIFLSNCISSAVFVLNSLKYKPLLTHSALYFSLSSQLNLKKHKISFWQAIAVSIAFIAYKYKVLFSIDTSEISTVSQSEILSIELVIL